MDVYIVTDGDYSDYRIKGVFLTEEDAEYFRDINCFKRVEPYTVGEIKEKTNLRTYKCTATHYRHKPFNVFNLKRCTNNIKFSRTKIFCIPPNLYCSHWNLTTYIVATSEEHAHKIAQERASAFIAGTLFAYYCDLDHCGNWFLKSYSYGTPSLQLVDTEIITEGMHLYD